MALTVHSLTLDHVAGVEHAALTLPETGVTIVHGPNESGKSTLLTAFRLLLSDVGVGSRKSWVRSLKSATDDEATTVAAELSIAAHRLRILKSFNKGGGRCELTVLTPRPENLTGREASDRFAEIVADGVDAGLIDALTIEQGSSLDILEAAGISGLEAALGSETVDPASGQLAAHSEESTSTLIDAVGAEYARYYTPGGKPAREFAMARNDVTEAEEAYTAAQQRHTQARALITRLEQLHAEKAATLRKQPEAAQAASLAQENLRHSQQVVAEREKLHTALAAGKASFEISTERLAARVGKVSELAELEVSVAELAEVVEQTGAAAQEEAARSQYLREEITQARRRHRVVAEWVTYLRAEDQQKRAKQKLSELTTRCEEAEQVTRDITEASQIVDNLVVTDDALAKLRGAEAVLRQAETVRDALATVVTITGPAAEAVGVGGHDEELGADGITVLVTGREVLTAGDFTVTVTPARDVHEVAEDVTAAAAIRDSLLAELAVDDLAAAEGSAAQRKQIEASIQEHRVRLARVTGGVAVPALEQERDRAGAEVADLTKAMAEASDRLHAADPAATEPPADDLEAMIVVVDEASREIERIQGELDRVTRSASTVRWETQRAKLEWAQSAHDHLQETLTAERSTTTDQQLEDAVLIAQEEVDRRSQALQASQDEAGEIDIAIVENLAAGADARVRRLGERAVEITTEISRVSGALGEHSGVAEEVEETKVAFERAQRNLRTVEQRAGAAHLLHQEISSALAEARQRYEAPLRQEIERLARTLYGTTVSFGLDGDLALDRRSLDGVTLPIDQLSGGAREQLAVLARLAVAELVGRGESVPVFIDDALGFSDQGRIGRMNVVLDTLGRDHQVIVLTCDLDRFDGIADASVISMGDILTTR